MVTPLKTMSYAGNKMAPKGVQGGAAPKIIKGARAAGEMFKKPGNLGLRGKSATDKSSGQSNPSKGGDDNRKRYHGVAQPVQYSNASGPKGTKFVC